MVACRLLLGAFEGGLFPGLVTYLTFFYTKRELALRIAALFTCSALAGACGGLLAFGIGYMDGKHHPPHLQPTAPVVDVYLQVSAGRMGGDGF